ncbi:MAG: hypothetical protein JWQ38_72 [Flavipsychrobacter sp.]|nr:hypothetical protein [Flavipsychrobacter sp.]
METIVVYSPGHSERLKFTLDWLLKERLQLHYKIVTSEEETKGLPFFIAYGKVLPNSLSIPDTGLLWQQGVQQHEPQAGAWKDIPTLYAVDDEQYSLPFDICSAIFYLLSRYEEYYPYKADKHDRYPATNSILHKKGWLQRPLVDEWVCALRKQVLSASGMHMCETHFLYQPTYDIDMAYSHLHKGMGRIIGAYIRAFVKWDVKQINERIQVLKKKQKDPFDSFRWLRQLHKEYDCKPVYFILSAFKTTAYDKNIHPEHPAMMRVIKNLAKEGTIGIHPSYYSDKDDILNKEKKMLEHISSRVTHISRQHYIKVKTPATQRRLIENHIKDDYSMGYGAYLGFRAGTGNSFQWYDVEQETITKLRIHPFCFMDTTAYYEGGLSVTDAFIKLDEMSKRLEQTGSTLVTIFHNFSLGTANEWRGWRQAYETFMQEKMELSHSQHSITARM